ncbi:hypothetical protein IT157_07845 [bacterium]|nr:hypothetical protein [bacterium]
MNKIGAFALLGILIALGAQAALPLSVPLVRAIVRQYQPMDTLYVIPAGPVAGGFTSESRIQVLDSIAGWAKIQMEGWAPASAIQWTSVTAQAGPAVVTEAGAVKQATQCTAITKKGTRCKRTAKPGSTRCWQHP